MEKIRKKFTQITKDKISKSKNPYKITQFSKEGKFIKVWNSAYDISKELNLCPVSIRSCIRGTTKSSGAYMWKKGEYIEDIEPIIPYKICNRPIRLERRGKNLKCIVYQYDMNENFIKEWFSQTIAAKELGLNYRCISSVCRGITKQHGGFKWSKTLII